MQLMERKLALIDSGGDPKLPVFLYNLDLANAQQHMASFVAHFY